MAEALVPVPNTGSMPLVPVPNTGVKPEDERVPKMMTAVENGDVDTIKHLVVEGLDVDVKDFSNMNNTALMVAARTGVSESIKALLACGARLDTDNVHGQTAVMCAIKHNQVETASLLIENGANIHLVDSNGDSPLILASQNGLINLCDQLIQLRADIHCMNIVGDTAVAAAFKREEFLTAKFLTRKGANMDMVNIHGDTLLHLAARCGNSDVLEFLIEQGANINKVNDFYFTPLICAVDRGHLEAMNLLIQAGSLLDVSNKYSDTALTMASRQSKIEMVKLLITSSASIDEGGSMKNSPLMHAAYYGQSSLVTLLLECGANINLTNYDGDTAVMCALNSTHEEVNVTITILVQAGADLDVINKRGTTALMEAIRLRKADLAKLFISAGANMELKSDGARRYRREVPLIAAVQMELWDVVLHMVQNGADVNAANIFERTPLSILIKNENAPEHVVNCLIISGANVNVMDCDGVTPLMDAATNGTVSSLRCLIKAGADVHHKCVINDFTALTFAALQDKHECVRLLMESGARIDNELHILSVSNKQNMVSTLVEHGALPTRLTLGTMVRRKVYQKTPLSPLCLALLKGRLDTANYFLVKWFLNEFDVIELPRNVQFLKDLDPKSQEFLAMILKKPWSLALMSFVVISTAVGFQADREDRVKALQLPQAFKCKLMYRDHATATTSVTTTTTVCV